MDESKQSKYPALVKAFKAMAADPESMAKIYEKTGKYDWIIGDDMKSALTQLRGQITRSTYTNLVDFLQFTGTSDFQRKRNCR